VVDDTIGNDGGITDKVGAPDGGSGERPADTRVGSHPGVMKLQDLLARSSIAVLSAPANDNATTYSGDALEFETTISGLSAGPLLTWVGADGHAHGHLALSAEFEAGGPSKAHEYAALNAALSDLGPVAPAQDGTRRIQVVEPRPGTFAIMWLALAESALVARGKMYVSEDASDGTGDTSWAKHTIEDVDLPGFMGGFGVASAGVGGDTLEIKYAAAGSSQSISVSTVRPGERTPDDGGQGHPAAEAASIAATAGPTVEVTAELEGETPSPRSSPASEPRPTQPLPASPMLEVGASIRIAAEAGTNETEPIVAALGDGFLVAWRAATGSEGLSQIKLALCDEHGAARTLADGNTVLLVSDRVATDAAPAVSSFGEGFAVAYKHGDDGDLVVKAYSAAGFQIGGEIVLHSHANGAIGEIAAAAIQADEQEGSDGDQLAVVYTVEDEVAGADDYGTIMLQRLAIAGEDGEAQSVTLGGDAGPALTVQTRDGCTAPAVGRAPAVVGLDNGELAIVWVENDGSRETIRGGVLELDGAQVLYIDLTDLIGAEGVVKGTEPTLLDAGNGNILVSWLQHDGDYVVMAALYQAVGHGVWVEPEQPMRLKSFDEEPDDYSVALTDAGGPAIVLTWDEAGKEPRNGDGILSQRYDMSGESQGGHVVIADRHALSMKQPASTDSLAAAGLADGQIVVVYAEQSAKGDFDLEAHIVDVPGPEESADKAIGPAKKL
jgi:hypothetical protein